jgi:S-adenosyl-L-methionine hydrolase (adenosine-forming)
MPHTKPRQDPVTSRRLWFLALLVSSVALTALLSSTSAGEHVARPAKPLIVFTSDFGTVDDAVAICKGVIKTIAPDAEIIDLSHQVTPFSIAEGARLLARTSQYYPSGTIFLTVIDPGVGTTRRSIVVKTKRSQYFVLPDNGLVTQVVDRDGVAGIREITNPKWELAGSSSSTFHGRDVYSPVAAHLQQGEDWREVGPQLTRLTRLEVTHASFSSAGIEGHVVALDGPFGNLVTDIAPEDIARLGYRLGDLVPVRISGHELELPFVTTFGSVAVGRPLLFIDSRGLLSLAINQGNFAKENRITPPTAVSIRSK